MTLPRIIGITGYAQHGKDTVASVFVEHGYQRVALADIMKGALEILNPIVNKYGNRLDEFLADANGYWDEAKKLPEVRRLLQVFGTEVGRELLGQDVWIEAAAKSVPGFYSDQGPRIVFSDIRFLNEAAFIRRMRGEVYRVFRPDFDNGVGREHASEREIGAIYHDERFTNDQDVDYLRAQVKRYINARTFYVDPDVSVYTRLIP